MNPTPRIKHRLITGFHTDNIATTIATKAFEHLFAPLYAEETKLAEELYASLLLSLKLDLNQIIVLRDAGVICVSSQITIDLPDPKDKSSTFDEIRVSSHYPTDDGVFLSGASSENPRIINAAYYDRASILTNAIKKLQDKAADLRHTLRDQIDGRSTKEVMAEWPEAANIIAEEMSLKVDPMVKPLEVLLAKFLPQLEAPRRTTISNTAFGPSVR